jgi:hypothetical protein
MIRIARFGSVTPYILHEIGAVFKGSAERYNLFDLKHDTRTPPYSTIRPYILAASIYLSELKVLGPCTSTYQDNITVSINDQITVLYLTKCLIDLGDTLELNFGKRFARGACADQ